MLELDQTKTWTEILEVNSEVNQNVEIHKNNAKLATLGLFIVATVKPSMFVFIFFQQPIPPLASTTNTRHSEPASEGSCFVWLCLSANTASSQTIVSLCVCAFIQSTQHTHPL